MIRVAPGVGRTRKLSSMRQGGLLRVLRISSMWLGKDDPLLPVDERVYSESVPSAGFMAIQSVEGKVKRGR